MVRGIEQFRLWFQDYQDSYLIIGGTACDAVLSEAGFSPRATKDFDIILIENRPGYVLKLMDWSNSKLVIHQENDYLNSQTSNYQMIYNFTTCIINTSDYITKQVRTINHH